MDLGESVLPFWKLSRSDSESMESDGLLKLGTNNEVFFKAFIL